MMRTLVILLLLMSLSGLSQAKPVVGGGDGGSLRPLPGQHPAVGMESEKIRITFLGNFKYAVLVDTVFLNQGPDRTISMCLPENNAHVDAGRGLVELNVRVDGTQVPTKYKVVSGTQVGDLDYDASSTFKVPFRHGQRRHVRVRYRSQTWGSCGQFLVYQFAGRRWAGTVAHTSVTMDGGGGLYYSQGDDLGVSAPSMPLRQGAYLSYYQWNHWVPKGTFTIG